VLLIHGITKKQWDKHIQCKSENRNGHEKQVLSTIQWRVTPLTL
jgi:hypothetical protein